MQDVTRNHADDDKLWMLNLHEIDIRIKNTIMEHGVTVIPHNYILANWDPSIRDCRVAIMKYDDINDDAWFEEIEEIAKKHNIKFTYITNIFYCGGSSKRVKILFLKELYGVFYNPNISHVPETPTTLYACLMQRTSYPRLKLFSELSKNNLLDKGMVSLLGFQTTENLSPNECVAKLNNKFNNAFSDIVQQFDFPFRTFEEPKNCFDIEKLSKYIIVLETYNDHINKKWISFTEKTFRSLQIPNISLLLNKKGSINALTEIGIKTHPINPILDYMESYNSQFNFVIGLLKNDIFDSVDADTNAKHNQNKLKEWSDILNTEEFYQDIIDNLL
jgi:hypothetical protein